MSTQNQKSKQMFVILFIFIIVGAGLIAYIAMAAADPIPNNHTGLDDDDNDNNNNTGDSTSPEPSVISADLWQSLGITMTNDDIYWVNAPETYKLDILGKSTDDTTGLHNTKSVQNSIWVQVHSDKKVTSWTFYCKESMYVVDSDGNTVATVFENKGVNADGQSLTSGVNSVITQASIASKDLETLLNNSGVPTYHNIQEAAQNPYQLKVVLTDITLTLHAEDDLTATLSPTSYDNDLNEGQNTLTWMFSIYG